MHEGFFRFKGEGMSIIRSSLAPEAGSEPGTRTKTEIRLEDERTLLLHVRAADISAFRAALNMWLRLISVAEEMQEIVKHG